MAGLLVNALLLLIFALTQLAEVPLPSDPFQVSILQPVANEEEEQNPRSSAASIAGASSSVAQQNTTLANPLVSAANRSQLVIAPISPFAGSGGFDTGLDLSGIGFGKAFSGTNGVGAAFRGTGSSNGSELIVIEDTSGSMRPYQKPIREIIRDEYPHSIHLHVNGCAITPNSSFNHRINTAGRRAKRTKILFICDLHDQQTPEGIEDLHALLIQKGKVIEFHVASVDKRPTAELMTVIEFTGGSYTRMKIDRSFP